MKKAYRELFLLFLPLLTIQLYAPAQDASGTYNMLVQKDAYVFEEIPNTNYGLSAELIAGRGLEFGHYYRIYLQFDHTPIPEDAQIISANLYMYMHSATTDQYRITLQHNSQSWDEGSITWNYQPADAYRIDVHTQTVGDTEGWVQFDITGTVRQWMDGLENEGLVVLADDKEFAMQNCVFYSKESAGCEPYIHVVYTSSQRIPDSPDAPLCDLTGDITPPELTLSFSSDPVTVGESVVVEATAEDPEGIYRLQIYHGSTLIRNTTQNATSLRASSTQMPQDPGPTMYFAVAYNDRMQCTRVSRRLMVLDDGKPPAVVIYHQPEHPSLGEMVTLYYSVKDSSGINQFEIEVNGVKHRISEAHGTFQTWGSMSIEDADIYYDPATTRVISYSATAYDKEGYHTNSGTYHILYDNGSGPDTDSDGIDDEIEEILGTDRTSDDTDNDGLYDYWEVIGLDRDNDGEIDLDLPGLGASPHHKDLFIECDWMEEGSHSHKPHPWAIQTAINQFLCYGIRLHVDVGSMGGGNAIPHLEDMGEDDVKLNHLLSTKLSHCDHARFGIFRYVLFGHGWGQYFGTGNMTVRTDPPNGNEGYYDEPYFQAKQFIHEIGHSLGLGHGGQTRATLTEAYTLDQQCYLFRNDVPRGINTNYKPNYLSMMNYLYSERNGLRALTSAGDTISFCGFSENIYKSKNLNENHLNESAGFDYPLDWGMYTWRRAGDTHHKLNGWFEGTYFLVYNNKWILADGSPIDWDLDGNDSETDVAAHLNLRYDTAYSTLTFENDVDNFILKICSYWQDRFLANGDSRREYELKNEVCDGLDNDFDGMIDEGFPDLDHDGVADFIDNALETYNPDQLDVNNNFIGDAAEVPLAKVTNLGGKFDGDHMYAELTWYRPKPAGGLLGYNVYMKDRSGVFKRMGISYPSTLEEQFSHNGPFLLGYEDTLTYYVRPVNLYLIEGERSDYITFRPKVSTLGTEVWDHLNPPLKCYPNPFTSFTNISYMLPVSEYVTVTIYNLLGERVRSLSSEYQSGGEHNLVWDGQRDNGQILPSGIYYCKVEAKNTLLICKMIISR